jgi:hypothetical protein
VAREKAAQDRGAKWLRLQGAWVYKTHGSQYGRAGVPDHLICWNGKFVALEWKNDTGRASDLQLREIRLIQNAGGVAHVVRSVEEMKGILECL